MASLAAIIRRKRHESRVKYSVRRLAFKRQPVIEVLESRRLLAANYVQMAESLDEQLVVMQSRVTGLLNATQTGATSSIPIVGDQLGRAANIVSSFRTELREALESFGTGTPTELQLQTVLAEHLGPFLGDAGPAGIQVTDAGNITTVEMTLHGSAVLDEVEINFDTGLPSLPISFTANGQLELSVGFALEVAFTIDDTTGVVALVDSDRNLTGVTAPDAAHPVVDTNGDLALFVSAGPSPDFNAKAVFGFVEGFATLLPGEANGLSATVLVSDLLGTPSVRIDGSADANLQLAGSFAGTNDDFPGISADFRFHWGLSSADPSFEPPTVSFDNVSLTFGTFLSNVLRPTLEPVQAALDPLSPVLSLLSTEVPGISDLSESAGAGPIRILDLAVLGSNLTGNGPLGELAGKITDLLTKIDSIQLGSNISLPLGGFDLNSTTNGDLRSAVLAGDFKDLSLASLSPLSAANLNNLAQSASQTLNNLIDDLEISEDLKSELHGLNALTTQNGFQIGFPILNDPAGVVFNMLLGRDADLFFFQADANAALEGSRATGLSFAGMPIEFFGQIDIDTHLRFAYDTFGLRQLIANLAAGDASHVVSDITDGFYINSDSYFKMAGAIGARFGSTFFDVFPVSISGGLFTQNSGQDPVHVYIEDPNADGKLRFNEFHLGSDDQPAAFKLTGELAAELNIEVGFPDVDPTDIFPAPPNESLEIAREVLIRFATLTPNQLASEPDANGEITLYLGTNADQRAEGQNQDDGDETFVIEHLRTNPSGSEDINVRAFGINQEIKNVRKIKATDEVGTLTILVQPGVTSDVDFDGGQGAAFLTYLGSGAANLTGGLIGSTLVGGSGPSILTGGPGDDTIILGSHTNVVDAAGGHNTVILSAPIYHPSTISGGTGFNNELQIIANATTTGITANPNGSSVDVGIVNGFGLTPVQLSFSHFDTVTIDASFSPTSFALGDLAAAGVDLLTLNMTTPYQSARQIDLDTRVANGVSDVTIRDYVVPEGSGAEIINATTGLTTRLLGFHSDDTLTLRHHGGSITVEPLEFSGGHFVFDASARAGNIPNVINITAPARDDGHLIVKESFRDVLITLTDYSSFLIKGDIAADQLNLNVDAASSGANTIDLDANSVDGELNVYLLGDETAINHVTLSRAGLQADVSVFGQNTTTDFTLGIGQLALIRNDVFTSNVQLAVDNDESTLASILTLDGTSFGTWNIPTLSGVTPQLVFSNLLRGMTVHGGAGDRFQLDDTPDNITSLTIDNRSMTTQDSVYTSNWSVPLTLLGNFSFYAGRVLHRDGTVERIKRLANVNSEVTFDYFFVESNSSVLYPTGPSEVIFDGDLDPPGSHYSIYGVDGPRPFNFVHNETVGLSVNVSGYSQDDQFYIYMPGATVDANLQAGPDATFYLDGQARLAGTNPTSPNNITIAARYGSTTMTPLEEFNSLLDMFNDVYILGAMPQDSLTVNVPTNVVISPSIQHIHYLAINPIAGWELTVPEGRVISWLSGNRGSGVFPFENIDAASWDQYFAPGAGNGDAPNPFTELPYGLVMPHDDGPIEVIFFDYFGPNGSRRETTFNGIARYWIVDATPEATNNNVRLNASQLRGDFNFNVAPPVYELARRFMGQGVAFGAITHSYAYGHPFSTWGYSYDYMRTAFGQSDITLSHTNPELTVDINGGNAPFTYTIQANQTNYHAMVVSPYSVTTLNVGDGVIANLRGNVTAQQVQLEVDDRHGTQPNIIAVTSEEISWFSSDNLRKSLTITQLRDDLTLTGGIADHFAVESTPALAAQPRLIDTAPLPVNRRVIIRNFAPADVGFASPDVYLMGHLANQPLDISGNLDLIIGRRLGTDGGVSNVGDLGGVVAFSGATAIHRINYTYTGSGRGQLIYDGSNFTSTTAPVSLQTDDSQAGRGALHWGYVNSSQELFNPTNSLNTLSFGGNTDFTIYAPIRGFFRRLYGGAGIGLESGTSAAISYFTNPSQPINEIDNVSVYSHRGPLTVTGRGSGTSVVLAPSNADGDLRTLITGNVSVSNAAVRIIPTNSGVIAAPLSAITLTATQLTGLTGGTVSFTDLANTTNGNSINPGLAIGLPHYGATSLLISGTPDDVITSINTVSNVPIGPTTIAGTNGELWLGPVGSDFNQNVDPRIEFQTASLVIGDGDLDAIQGIVFLGDSRLFNFAPGGVTIDNQTGVPNPNVVFSTDPARNSVKLEGFAPVPIYWKTYLTTQIDVLGMPGSHYNVSRATRGTRLFAGLGSTVDTNLAGLTILGAETVRVTPTNNASHFDIQVIPDPARPDEVTELTFDSTQRSDIYFLDTSNTNLGMGRIAGGTFSQASANPYVHYEADNTNLTFLGLTAFQSSSSELNVTDTPAITTDIAPGNLRLNVSATTNPLGIDLAPGSQLNLGTRSANASGSTGDMRPLLGSIAIAAQGSSVAPAAIRFNSSIDPTPRTVSLNHLSSDDWNVAGMTSNPVPISGSNFTLALDAGTGASTFVGPDIASQWLINGTNSGKLNQTITFSGMHSIVSGSQNDTILFKPTGLLAGNLDGGAGIDTLYYQNGMLTGTDVIDLPSRIAPRVTGQALNLESSGSYSALTITNPGSLSSQAGTPMTPVDFSSASGFGQKTFTATGLPDGILINSLTGVLSGTPLTENQFTNIAVTVTDDTGSASASFFWSTLPGLIMSPLFNRTSQANEPIQLQVQTSYTYGGTLAFSATNLPAGLSIEPQTGLISGTIADGAQTTSPYFVNVQVTDGAHSASRSFNWNVIKSLAVLNPGNQFTPESVPISLPIQVINATAPVTYTAFGLPSFLSIHPQTGVISGTIGNYSSKYLTFNVTVQASSSQGTASTNFTWQNLPGFTPQGIFNRTSNVGDVVSTRIYAIPDFNSGAITVDVTNLPPGLSYDTTTGFVQGSIDHFADAHSPYHSIVTFHSTVFNYDYSMSFDWTIHPSIVLASPGNQSSLVGDVISLDVPVLRDLGSPISFSASGLPLGLEIDPVTGQISGTVGPQTSSSTNQSVSVFASDGTSSTSVGFQWQVASAAANIVVLADTINGGTVTLTSPIGTTLVASLSSPFDVYPYVVPFAGIHFGSGYLSLRVEDVNPGDAVNVTMTPSSTKAWESFYVYGPSPSEPEGWFQFLYQQPTDANDASTTGAEFLPNGHIVLHLVDDARGDFNLAEPGVIELGGGPTVTRLLITNLGDTVSVVGDSISRPLQTQFAHGTVSFSATGLPEGLSIDAQTGLITGTISSAAVATEVTVTASDDIDEAEITFAWQIFAAGFANYISVNDPGTQTSHEGDFAYISINAFNSLDLPLTYTVTGLPPGLQLYSNEGSYEIYGNIDLGAAAASPYQVQISATDGRWTGEASFDWIVTVPGTVQIYSPGPWYALVNETIDFSIADYTYSPLGDQLTFSATDLPTGLAIDSQTGIISGTISPLASLPARFQSLITATTPSGSDTTTILWTISSSYQSNVVTLPNLIDGGFFTVTSPEGTALSASISTTTDEMQPNGVSFPLGFLSFKIEYLPVGEAADLQIDGINPGNVYYNYGATPANSVDHWYNFLFGSQTDSDSAVDTGMELVGEGVILHLLDGSRGDNDLVKNGVIFGKGGPAIADVTLNHPPILTPIGDKTINEQQLLSFVVTAADSNDDPPNNVTLSVSPLPAGATFDPATGQFSWTPGETQHGSYALTFTATDDGSPSQSSSETITIIVNDLNTLSTIIAPEDVVTQQLFDVSATFVGLDGEDYTATIDWGDGTSSVGFVEVTPEGVRVTTSHAFVETSDYTVVVALIDSIGGSTMLQKQIAAHHLLLLDDPAHPGQSVLAVGGTPRRDRIFFTRSTDGLELQVLLNSVTPETYSPGDISRIEAYGGGHNDLISLRDGISIPAILVGGAGNDVIYAGSGSDTIIGGAGRDTIVARSGNDWIDAGDDNDLAYGDAGEDTILGGNGNDILLGGAGSDTIDGEAGSDVINGDVGNDALSGGAGNDYLYGDAGKDSLQGGDGNDRLYGGVGNDTVHGGIGNDRIYGNDGQDFLDGDGGNDLIDGGLGRDTISGGDGNDTLSGGDNNDLLTGGEGDDLLRGGDGNDQLYGNGGDDHINGNAGNDTLVGGAGTDTLIGGPIQDVEVQDELPEIDGDAEGEVENSTPNGTLAQSGTRDEFPMNRDVNGDGRVSALDALQIINRLNRVSNSQLIDDPDSVLDVNGDGQVTALDALTIIDAMRQSDLLNLSPTSVLSSLEQSFDEESALRMEQTTKRLQLLAEQLDSLMSDSSGEDVDVSAIDQLMAQMDFSLGAED